MLQRGNPLLHPPKSLHLPKPSHFDSIRKKPNIILHYLPAPAWGSKVCSKAKTGAPLLLSGDLEGRIHAYLGVEDVDKQNLPIPNLEKATLKKALELCFHSFCHSWRWGFEGWCTVLGWVQQPTSSMWSQRSGQCSAPASSSHTRDFLSMDNQAASHLNLSCRAASSAPAGPPARIGVTQSRSSSKPGLPLGSPMLALNWPASV